MASVFWDSRGTIMIDYLEQCHTINGAYDAPELKRLRQEIARKRRGKLTRGVLLLQDNAPANDMTAVSECGFEVLPHPPYSLYLDPSDFYLFPKLKSNLRGTQFGSNEGVIAAVNEYLKNKEKDFYLEEISKLEQRWT